jgi:hypothetical protein
MDLSTHEPNEKEPLNITQGTNSLMTHQLSVPPEEPHPIQTMAFLLGNMLVSKK